MARAPQQINMDPESQSFVGGAISRFGSTVFGRLAFVVQACACCCRDIISYVIQEWVRLFSRAPLSGLV